MSANITQVSPVEQLLKLVQPLTLTEQFHLVQLILQLIQRQLLNHSPQPRVITEEFVWPDDGSFEALETELTHRRHHDNIPLMTHNVKDFAAINNLSLITSP